MEKQRLTAEQPLQDKDETPAYCCPHLVEVGRTIVSVHRGVAR
jgi:hypothetical protein